MSGCDAFRARLEASLEGRAEPAGARELGWHEHLLACEACRALLEAEQALEVVLASLPEPRLPARLAERVLARLARARGDDLDLLLALDRVAPDPRLAERVLAGLAEERRLDALLDRAGAAEAPAGLAERVLARLAQERRPVAIARARSDGAGAIQLGTGTARRRPRRLALAAAAAALALALAWLALRRPGAADPARVAHGPRSGASGAAPHGDALAEPDAELLLALDVLERWDLLVDEDAALLFAALDPVDEQLLALAFDPEDG